MSENILMVFLTSSPSLSIRFNLVITLRMTFYNNIYS